MSTGDVAREATTLQPTEGTDTPTVPGYRVMARLHRGTRLEVFDAWSAERDCRVIIKTLRPDRAREQPAQDALIREGDLLRRLTHPHIVRAYETVIARDPPQPAIVMEVLTGETLGHLLERYATARRRLSVREVALLGTQLVSAVGYLHRRGLLHLDLKPGNIIIESGRAKLIDLSIARAPGTGQHRCGTRGYMSPEQSRGRGVTEAADVWGLGVVLFEALTGSHPGSLPPDGPDTLRDVLDEGVTGRLAAVGSLRRIPRPLSSVVDGCLDLDPERRPGLVEISSALQAVLGADILGA